MKEIEKAIKVIKDILSPCHRKCTECVNYEYLGEAPHGKYICNSLEYQASKFVISVLEKPEQEREWIPVSEKPKEKSGTRILVTLKNEMVTECFWIGETFKYTDGWKMKRFELSNQPIAWQQLPAPYKEVNDGQRNCKI